MTDNNLTEVNEYESWGAGTLLVAKKDLMFIVNTPDPWDFQSENYDEVDIGESENFILVLPAAREVFQCRHYVVFRILHPVFGKTMAVFVVNGLSSSVAERIQKSFKRVVTDEA